MRSTLRKSLLALSVAGLAACNHSENSATERTAEATPSAVADKPFVTGGKITFDLDGGGYEIRPAADNHIRVALTGAPGNSKVDVAINGSDADVKIKDTPHSNFRATVEVPAAADVVVRLTGGELKIEGVTGNKDVESMAGNVQIGVGDPKDYASVDAAVKAGDLDAQPFGGSKSGLLQEFTWSGTGKHTLRAHLGAGNLVLTSK